MRKIHLFLMLAAMVIVFVGLWAFRWYAPMTPNNVYSGDTDDVPWWERSNGGVPTPDEEWVLDPEIPSNYIPVLGGEELYMVLDENGNVLKYRQRTKSEDGSWVWSDVDPNIPGNFVPVEGLENVYMTTGVDGKVHYYRYTRNPDDTYFFEEVDENGVPLAAEPDGSEIPPNYVHVSGNIYAVYNEYGVLTGYKERVLNEDGTYSWVDVDAPQEDTGTGTGNGSIPGIGDWPDVNQGGSGSGGSTVIVSGGDDKWGYTERETVTRAEHSDGWVIIYETIVYRHYDENGELAATETEGPTEVNRIPESEYTQQLIEGLPSEGVTQTNK